MRFSLAWSIHQKGYPGVEAPVWIRIPSNIKFCSVNQELICQLSRLISPLSPESHPVSPFCRGPRNYSSGPSKHAGTSTAATWGILQPQPLFLKAPALICLMLSHFSHVGCVQWWSLGILNKNYPEFWGWHSILRSDPYSSLSLPSI